MAPGVVRRRIDGAARTGRGVACLAARTSSPPADDGPPGTADAAGTAAASPNHHLSISECGEAGRADANRPTWPMAQVGRGSLPEPVRRARYRGRALVRPPAPMWSCCSSCCWHAYRPATPRRSNDGTSPTRKNASPVRTLRASRAARPACCERMAWREALAVMERERRYGERGAARPGNTKSRRRWSARGDVLCLGVRASARAHLLIMMRSRAARLVNIGTRLPGRRFYGGRAHLSTPRYHLA